MIYINDQIKRNSQWPVMADCAHCHPPPTEFFAKVCFSKSRNGAPDPVEFLQSRRLRD